MRHIVKLARLLLAGDRRKRTPPNLPPVTAPDAATVFSATPTIVDVLANDSDPEGGLLTIASATALQGTVQIRPDRTILYTSAAGFAGTDTVTYVARDPLGAQRSGTLTVTVAAPPLSLSPTADGTLSVAAATGALTITVTTPTIFAGTYATDTALLAGGAVSLVPPRITGQTQAGAVLTAQSGLWIFEGQVTGESWAWRRNGTAIAGATAATYTVTAADQGAALTVVQTLTTAAGSRSATSAGLSIPVPFTPASDTGVVLWYDASVTATITRSGTTVTAWVPRTGTGNLAGTSGPTSGTRTINGLNVIDFAGVARVSGAVTLPAAGNVAFHMVVAIDSVANAFASLISTNATRDFQLEANNATAFSGRLSTRSIGDSYNLAGGPWAGLRIVSIVFDRTGAGTARVLVNGTQVGTGVYSTALDSAATLAIMTNRNQNAYVDGAVGEVVVTQNLGATADHIAYLAAKWGVV
jgi:hypothetical protein